MQLNNLSILYKMRLNFHELDGFFSSSLIESIRLSLASLTVPARATATASLPALAWLLTTKPSTPNSREPLYCQGTSQSGLASFEKNF